VKPAPQIKKSRFAFLTLPNYSAIAVSNAVEPLRMANSVSGQAAYEWVIVSLDGQPVPASNGLALSPTVGLTDTFNGYELAPEPVGGSEDLRHIRLVGDIAAHCHRDAASLLDAGDD